MTRYALENAGSLEAIEILGGNPGPQTPTIVMIHGYGADAHDLAPLSHVFKVPEGTRWLFPQGPLEVPIGPFYSGRAWAPINMEEWQRAMMEGRPRDLSGEKPPELFTSAQKIMEMLKLKNAPIESVIFAGFSQGAMLATHLTLSSKVKPRGLIIFSGSLINGEQWEQWAPQYKGFRYFQSHGLYDDVLSIQGADKLHDLFVKNGLVGDYVKFEGSHEIPPLAVNGAQKYLYDIFPKAEWEKHDH